MTPSLLASRSSFSAHSDSGRPERADRLHLDWLLSAFTAGWFVRMMVALFAYKTFLDPGRGHWEFGYEIGRVARSIVAGSGFSNPYWANTGPTALLTPVYPYFLACIFTVFGVYTKASAMVFVAANTFFSAVTVVPIFLIARRNFDLRTARLAVWVWAFFPYAINFSATTMWYHSLVALLLAIIFLSALSMASSGALASWAAFGVLLGFAALTNPVLIAAVPFLGGWLWAQRSGTRRRALLALTVGFVAMTVTLVPWLVRNESMLHRPVVFKDGFWMEVCVGNVNSSLHWWDGKEHPSGSESDNALFERLGESNYMALKRSRAMVFVENHPAEYARRCIRRVVFMWTGIWSLDRTYLRQEPFDPANIFLLSSLSVLSFAGIRYLVRAGRGRTATLYLLVLFSFPIPYYLSHLDPGFRHPVDPLLVILACSTVTRLLSRARTAAAKTEHHAELLLSR